VGSELDDAAPFDGESPTSSTSPAQPKNVPAAIIATMKRAYRSRLIPMGAFLIGSSSFNPQTPPARAWVATTSSPDVED
jgi:hypothetical protein